jgi:hypothetical protein
VLFTLAYKASPPPNTFTPADAFAHHGIIILA